MKKEAAGHFCLPNAVYVGDCANDFMMMRYTVMKQRPNDRRAHLKGKSAGSELLHSGKVE